MNDKEKEAIEEIGLIIESFYDFPNPISIELKDKDVKFLETILNLIENQKAEIEQLKIVGNGIELLLKQKVAEIEEKDREIIRCSRAANEYKKAVKCKECDCCICEAHINTLELSAEIEKKDKEIKCLKCLHNTQVEIIDLMAEEFVSKTLMYSDMTKEEVKQYFENKAEEDK